MPRARTANYKFTDTRKTRKKSKWDRTLEKYRKLEAEGRLDEIEPVPEEIERRVEDAARSIVRAGKENA